MTISPDECAREVLETVPLVMRTIRAEMRSLRTPDLTVPQYRTLNFLNHNQGSSLSNVAEHIGLTLPSMSTLVDGLVTRSLVSRQTYSGDRRRVTLALTARGRATLQASCDATQAHLAERLAALPASERAIVMQAMQALRPIFTPSRESEVEKVR
jgi:MarR family transcriptional regulator for hemolysin